MDEDLRPETSASTGALVGVGCVTALAGMFAGGMIAVFIGKIIGSIRGCQPVDGTPACDWNVYAAVGMVIGIITLPIISITRLKSRRT